MRRVLWIVVLLAVVGCGPRTWTKADTAREAAYLALHVVDWGQTLYISDHPGEYHENNPVLGSHPSRGEVNWYFAVTGLLHPVISYALPDDWRPWWQWGTIGVEAVCVGNNYGAGIRMGW